MHCPTALSMCEIARNSVLQSGFPDKAKKHWIGATYHRRGAAGNIVKQSNVPNIRLLFRDELLAEEENWILGLPPPIFPSIKLDQRWKTKKKKSLKPKADSRMRRVSEQMNYLVKHRTKIPFNLHSVNSPPRSPNQSKDGNGSSKLKSVKEQSSKKKYDPLGYFTQSGKAQDDAPWYRSVKRNNAGGDQREDIGNSSVVHSVQSSMKRHLVTVAIGVVVGILVTVGYQRTMGKDKARRK